MAGRKPGGKKTGGRKPGTPNKSNQFPRKILIDLLAAQGDKPYKELAKLQGKEYIECYEKLMKYILPQLKAVEHTGDQPKSQTPFQFIIQQLPDDSAE